jgi:hypothetical protein
MVHNDYIVNHLHGCPAQVWMPESEPVWPTCGPHELGSIWTEPSLEDEVSNEIKQPSKSMDNVQELFDHSLAEHKEEQDLFADQCHWSRSRDGSLYYDHVIRGIRTEF